MEIITVKNLNALCKYCAKAVSESKECFYVYEPTATENLDMVEVKTDRSVYNTSEIYHVCDSPECITQLMDQKQVTNIEELNPVEISEIKIDQDIDDVIYYFLQFSSIIL